MLQSTQAWGELSSLASVGSMYDIASDTSMLYMDFSIFSLGVDSAILSQLKQNYEKLTRRLNDLKSEAVAMEIIVRDETERAAGAETELLVARKELLLHRRKVLKDAFASSVVDGIPTSS